MPFIRSIRSDPFTHILPINHHPIKSNHPTPTWPNPKWVPPDLDYPYWVPLDQPNHHRRCILAIISTIFTSYTPINTIRQIAIYFGPLNCCGGIVLNLNFILQAQITHWTNCKEVEPGFCSNPREGTSNLLRLDYPWASGSFNFH